MRHVLSLACAVAVCGQTLAADTFYTDRSLFLGDARLGTTNEVLFDNPAQLDANMNGANLFGAQLNALDTLIVIDATTGVRFPMTTSSGTQLISPGGQSPDSQNDDLMITFDTPRQSFGIDVVFDVADGLSFVGITFYDAAGHAIATSDFIPSPDTGAGYQFLGLVSDGPTIAAVVINDFDDSPSDDNIGYDSLIFSVVPAPNALGLLGLAALATRRRR